jgi:hypothetical protein
MAPLGTKASNKAAAWCQDEQLLIALALQSRRGPAARRPVAKVDVDSADSLGPCWVETARARYCFRSKVCGMPLVSRAFLLRLALHVLS